MAPTSAHHWRTTTAPPPTLPAFVRGWEMTLVLLATLPLLVAVVAATSVGSRSAAAARAAGLTAVAGHGFEALAGVRAVYALGLQDAFSKTFATVGHAVGRRVFG